MCACSLQSYYANEPTNNVMPVNVEGWDGRVGMEVGN